MTKKFLLTLIFTSCLKDVSSSFMIEQEKIKSKDSTETVKNNIITKNSNDFSNQNYYTSNSDKIDDTKKKKKKKVQKSS